MERSITTFFVQTQNAAGERVTAEGYVDGSILIRRPDTDDLISLPPDLVRQLRAELESQALDRVAAYARERAEDMLVARDRLPSTARELRMRREAVSETYREMAAKAIAEKEN